MANEPSTPNEPAQTQDVPNTGDPLTQMVTDAKEKFGDAPSTGEPGSTEPTATADVAGQTDSGTPEPEDFGETKRLEQINAGQRTLLTNLGIDPDSDKVRQFSAGLITKEELLQAPVQSVQPTEIVGADRLAKLTISVAEQRKKGELPTANDFYELLEVTSQMAEEGRQKDYRAEVDKTTLQCIGAAGDVIEGDEIHRSLPEDIQEIEKQVFVASTDRLWAESTGASPQQYTPSAYKYYAKQNIEGSYDKLRNAWIEYGKNLGKGPPPEPSVNTNINPISSVEGGAPMSQPKTMIKLGDSMQEAVKQYSQQHQVR